MRRYIMLFAIFAVLILGCTSPQTTQPPQQPPATTGGGTSGEFREIQITAKQFEFSPNVIKVKKGEKIRFVLTSLDVAHGFGSADLGFNSVIEPGKTTTVEFTADKTGTFTFRCTTVCGAGHGTMTGQIIVE